MKPIVGSISSGRKTPGVEPDRPARVAAADLDDAAALGSRKRPVAARRDAAVQLAHQFRRLRHRPRERQPVRSARRSADARWSGPRGSRCRCCRRRGSTARSWRRAATRRSRWCRGRGRSRSTRSAAWSRSGCRTPAAPASPAARGSSWRCTMSSTSWVLSPVTVSTDDSGARVRRVMLRPLIQPAVNLQLGDRADAEADAERRHAAAGCPSGPTPGTDGCARSRGRLRSGRGPRRSTRDPRSPADAAAPGLVADP